MILLKTWEISLDVRDTRKVCAYEISNAHNFLYPTLILYPLRPLNEKTRIDSFTYTYIYLSPRGRLLKLRYNRIIRLFFSTIVFTDSSIQPMQSRACAQISSQKWWNHVRGLKHVNPSRSRSLIFDRGSRSMRRARVSCVNESTNQFFNAPRNALNLENGDANRIHSRMRWYCIWLCQCWMTIVARDCFICESWRTSTRKVDWIYSTRVPSHFLSQLRKFYAAFHTWVVFIAFACDFETTNDDDDDVDEAKLLHLPSIPDRFDAF